MAHDPNDLSFMRHDYQAPTASRPVQLAERLFTLTKGTSELAIGLVYRGEQYGVEVQVWIDRSWVSGERCANKPSAVALATEIRTEHERDGWSLAS